MLPFICDDTAAGALPLHPIPDPAWMQCCASSACLLWADTLRAYFRWRMNTCARSKGLLELGAAPMFPLRLQQTQCHTCAAGPGGAAHALCSAAAQGLEPSCQPS